MAYINEFNPAPAPWLPYQDREVIDRVPFIDYYEHEGKHFENPEFELKVVHDVHNYFAIDLFYRIKASAMTGKKLAVVLPSPENAVFINVAENLNKYQVSAENVEIFFLYEYANEDGKVAPWQSPYARSGHFMRYFYQRVEEHLRMPMENIHFFTAENVNDYSKLIEEAGGADVAYTSLTWGGGIGAIDAESYKATTMEEFLAKGSGIVAPMMETIAHDSLRGMFGMSGDIWNVPMYAATVGPKDLAAAKERIDVEYLTACGGEPGQQRFASKLALFGPVCPEIPASMLRLYPGCMYVSEQLAKAPTYANDEPWLDKTLEEIRKAEEGR